MKKTNVILHPTGSLWGVYYLLIAISCFWKSFIQKVKQTQLFIQLFQQKPKNKSLVFVAIMLAVETVGVVVFTTLTFLGESNFYGMIDSLFIVAAYCSCFLFTGFFVIDFRDEKEKKTYNKYAVRNGILLAPPLTFFILGFRVIRDIWKSLKEERNESRKKN